MNPLNMNHPFDGNDLNWSGFNESVAQRWGGVPEVPLNFDTNAMTIPELVAWVSAFIKKVMADQENLEMEFTEFTDEIVNLISILVPSIIIEYVNSDEFKEVILNIINDWWYNSPDNWEARFVALENEYAALYNEVIRLNQRITNAITECKDYTDGRIAVLQDLITNLTTQVNNHWTEQQATAARTNLMYNNLAASGNIQGGAIQGNIVTGAINVYGNGTGAANGIFSTRSGIPANSIYGGR